MPHFKHIKQQLTAVATAASLAILGISAQAQEKVKIKFADWMPVSHYTVVNGAKVFMDKAVELSKGQIEFQYFPAEQLGKAKDMSSLAQSGVADIVDVSPSYISEKFPLSSVAELPAMFKTSCEGSNAYGKLVKDGDILAENEFKPNGLRVLTWIAYAPYKVATTKKEISTLHDFSGLKLRTAGGAMDLTASKLGAVSVRMAGPDILPSMSRGTLDGALLPLQSVKIFGLETALKHQTVNTSLGSFVTVYAISDKAWTRFPANVRDALIQAGAYASKNHCEYVDREEAKVIPDLEKNGVKANTMAPNDLKTVEDALVPVRSEWAAELDKRGRPGTKTLAAFTKALQK